MYATYAYYTSEWYGSICTSEDWPKYGQRASDYIDYITMGKAATYTDTTGALKKACCAVAEQIAQSDALTANITAAGGEVASETVGSHSVSYRSSTEVSAALKASMLSAAQTYLLPTGLLYRGAICIRRIP